ncbi:MAG: hypothetical protein LUE91_05450 [Oscillospiraceae bacterium]|nr:hypothetical protein [Oscillospiraceae bacterium]
MEKANETTEQQAVMDWAAYAVKRWPGLRNLYHVPNEARRSPARGCGPTRPNGNSGGGSPL